MTGKIPTPYDELTYTLTGLAMTVHSELGPGLTEETYKKAMVILLDETRTPYQREYPVAITFRGQNIAMFKLDFVVAATVIIEAKAVSTLAAIHEQQSLTYLAASSLPVALLSNFGAGSLEHKRLFPSKAVQNSIAYKSRQRK